MRYLVISLSLLLSLNSCILLPMPEKKMGDEERLLKAVREFSDNNLFEEAIENCQDLMKYFPDSQFYDVALLWLGEAYEGLLNREYHQLIESGQSEKAVRVKFLENYGHYQCWEETPCGLRYNLAAYKEMMERFPDSRWADEATYNLIPWVCDYNGAPDGPLEEIGYLEKVLQEYPTTSLKPKIFYQIAYRFQILYEISAFSPHKDLRDDSRSMHYREQSAYFYKMALKYPVHSKFSRLAWENLGKLEKDERIYLTE